MNKRALVVNLFGGPGTGKSTTMAGLFHLLKSRGVNAEMAPEYAKDKVWEKGTHVLGNQIYIFGHQHHRLWRLIEQTDVVVTDSPLLLQLYYGRHCSETFRNLIVEEYLKMQNLNVFLRRAKKYSSVGRMQTEEEAKAIDIELIRLLGHRFPYIDVTADEQAPEALYQIVVSKLDVWCHHQHPMKPPGVTIFSHLKTEPCSLKEKK